MGKTQRSEATKPTARYFLTDNSNESKRDCDRLKVHQQHEKTAIIYNDIDEKRVRIKCLVKKMQDRHCVLEDAKPESNRMQQKSDGLVLSQKGKYSLVPEGMTESVQPRTVFMSTPTLPEYIPLIYPDSYT